MRLHHWGCAPVSRSRRPDLLSEESRIGGAVPSLPSGTVTFLFTDIEGSSTLWEQHPEAMKTALRRHDEMVRRAIESNDGAVVKTTGDGFHAAFSTADSAVEAAIQVQVGLDGELWPETGPLRVRIGLHTGTAE